jgi:hypothetical protein
MGLAARLHWDTCGAPRRLQLGVEWEGGRKLDLPAAPDLRSICWNLLCSFLFSVQFHVLSAGMSEAILLELRCFVALIWSIVVIGKIL